MNQIKNFTRKFIKRCLKFILYATVIIILLLGSVIIALQFPFVQTKVVNKAATYLSESLNFPIYLEGIDIDWFDEIVLEGVTVYDPQKGKMIYLKEAVVDFEIISVFKAKFNIDEITLKNGRVNMVRYAPDGFINMTEFIDALREMSTPSEKNRKPVPFTVKHVTLENMYFSYFDKRKLIETEGFDQFHFAFDSINASIKDLRIIADTFQINVFNLNSTEVNTKLKIHELNTLFTITKSDMTFDKLYADIGESIIKNYIQFNYKDINDLSDFNEKIEVIGKLDKSKINFNNLSEFAPGLKPFRENVIISGLFKGYVTDFRVKNLDLSFGKSSNVQGKISFNGLPEFEETFIELKFSHSNIHANDLKQYLDNRSYSILKKFGNISGKGEFVGFPQDFVTKGSFKTDLGNLVSDMRLDAKSETEHPKYEGHLKTYSFNLGKLVDLPQKVQLIDMDGTIKGSGFSLENAEAVINADISRIGINNYNYTNIKTNAKLSEREFHGTISVKDTNLVFNAIGHINLDKSNKINVQAHFEKANLKPLNISNIETLIKTDLSLDLTGNTIDEITGDIFLNNTYLLYNHEKEISIKYLSAESRKTKDLRTLKINSDLLSMNVSGNFSFLSLEKDMERLYKEYELSLINESYAIYSYYKNKGSQSLNKYSLDFKLNIKNLNSLFEIYLPGLYLSQGVTIEGNFLSGHNSILNINTHIDTLFYKGNELYNTNLDISSSKLADSSNVLAMVYANSAKQKLGTFPETRNFFFEGIWDKKTINFSTNIFQSKSTNNINLKGDLSFLENNKLIKLNNSSFNLLNETWNISPDNKIYFAKEDITFANFVLGNKNQSISLNGTISNDEDKAAELKIVNFDLENVNNLIAIENQFKGTVNGNITIKDLYKDLDMDGKININEFSIDGFLIGNIIGNSKWDNSKNQLDIKMDVERSNKTTISIDGFIKPQTETKKEQINLVAHLDDAELKILSPLLKGIMSDISGKVNGDFKISGTMKDLAFKGRGEVKKGQIKIDYLGTTYYFDDYIYMEENSIGFKKLKLKDEFGNTGIIDGGISHDGFKDFLVDIQGYLNQLNVLSTTEKDNNLFYGTAFVTGDFEILGPFSNLNINANATSNKGTKIYIPLNSFEGLEKQTFISFTSRKNLKKKDEDEKVDLSGIKLDFNFELTPDAYAEIIFDKRAGDIIRGYGNGDIKMTIDTRGDFNMYGNYRMVRGAYNYTFAGLISKEFTIEPNSSITWTGDPYGGILDVRAFFENKVSITPLISDSITRKQEVGRTHPVKVILDLDGELMSPQISMDIDITPTTPIGREVATRFESEIKRNEQELNKQVFSLLAFGNFSSENSFSGTAGPASSVSQLLTNQLGNWLSQVDENLIIDIDLNGLDREALNTFNLRLSYTLLDGRLRISRDGSFSNFQNPNQNVSNIAGEWTVEYLLSKEGKFRLKLYNKNNQNILLNSMNAGNFTSAGFSVLHTQTFSNLNELLGIKKKNKPIPENTNKEPINLALPKEDEEVK